MSRDDFRDMARRAEKLIPEGLKEARADFDANLRPLLQSALGKLDLVTREEFDIQRGVLARTRDKVERLEKVVAALEKAGKS